MMHRNFYHFLFVFILFILVLFIPETGFSQFLGYTILGDRKKVKLSFEIYNNLIIVPVKLNGIIPLKMVIDTGVRSSIITDKFITDILRLPYSRKITVNGPGDFIVLEAYVVNKVDILFQGLVGADQSILVLEEDYLQLRNYLGTEVHGLVGYDLFNRFVVEVDYTKKILTLHEPDEFKSKRGFTELPLLIEDSKPYIQADVLMEDSNQFSGKFMVDTGASHALLINENSIANIHVPAINLKTDIGRGLGGPISGEIAYIDHIKIDKFSFRDLIASFPDPESYPDTIGLVYRNGTVGGELLTRFTVIFDYFNEKIYLKRNSRYKKPFGYNMSGLTVIAEGEELKKFQITEVRRESPAFDAGIKADDFIEYVNGISIEKIGLNDLYKLFNFGEGKKINLIISRNGETKRVKFRLRDMLAGEK
jgi:predicted aspartyl protease